MTHGSRFIYDTARTRTEAELRLENYFATGEIYAAELPLIQPRKRTLADGTSRTNMPGMIFG